MSAIEDFDDLSGPMAPSAAAWAAMSEAERRRIEASLPHEVVHDFMSEGDVHAGVVIDLADALRNHYGGGGPGGRACYIGRSVMVHYPETRAFAPDLFVVFDVHDHPRSRFVVSREGRGLDIAFEVLCDGDANKDYRRNVALYAQVGIAEYFILDPLRKKLTGYRLEPGDTAYRPVLGQHGQMFSAVLGLWIAQLGGTFRLLSGNAVLPTTLELKARLGAELERAILDAAAAEERAEAESERARAESERAAVESERATAESERATAESERATAESERATAESERATVESERAAAESKRATAESERAARLEVEVLELQATLARLQAQLAERNND